MMRSLFCATLLASCGAFSAAESEVEQAGPGAVHPGWFKSPEAISETIVNTWQLELTPEEDLTYVASFRSLLGGVSVTQHGSLLEKPHELFALAIHSLSVFVAEKLIAKQVAMSQAGESYLFDGLGFSPADDGCYANDAKDWCDGKDGLFIGEAATWNSQSITKEQRKRLMHKMQSIGEFFLMAIDERTLMPGQNRHAPAFLVDDVFLPKLREDLVTVEQEMLAWREVVATILMSGYFFDLPAEQ